MAKFDGILTVTKTVTVITATTYRSVKPLPARDEDGAYEKFLDKYREDDDLDLKFWIEEDQDTETDEDIEFGVEIEENDDC